MMVYVQSEEWGKRNGKMYREAYKRHVGAKLFVSKVLEIQYNPIEFYFFYGSYRLLSVTHTFFYAII